MESLDWPCLASQANRWSVNPLRKLGGFTDHLFAWLARHGQSRLSIYIQLAIESGENTDPVRRVVLGDSPNLSYNAQAQPVSVPHESPRASRSE
jgi:hypothetical protein